MNSAIPELAAACDIFGHFKFASGVHRLSSTQHVRREPKQLLRTHHGWDERDAS